MKKLFFTTIVIFVYYLSFSQINYVPNVTVTTFAGKYKSFYQDGPVSTASFYNPYGIVVDASGNIYVADNYNNVIRKITPGGIVSTFAGNNLNLLGGSADGQGAAASFNYPTGLAIDASGNIYVADAGNHKIRKITPSGLVSTFAGSGVQGAADGQGTAATFTAPYGVTVDASGNLFVADTYNNIIRKITSGGLVSTFAGSGTAGSSNGLGTAASFSQPIGIAVDPSGNLFIAESSNSQIRKISPSGFVSPFAGSTSQGSADGQGSAAKFIFISNVATDASGNVYVTDQYNSNVRKITPGGLVSTLAGSTTRGSADGQGSAARFNNPLGLTVDANGNVYIADSQNNEIRKITSTGLVSTVAGSTTAGNLNGQGTVARFYSTTGMAIDASGNLYVNDDSNQNIRKITPGGLVSTLAGNTGLPGIQGYVDGQGAVARFNSPSGIAVDASGNVYVSEAGNNIIRKITSTGFVNTFAGNLNSGHADGQGVNASFSNPSGLAIDAFGNIFVADNYNNTIRKITPSGLVSTFAGSGTSGSADGQGIAASFNSPKAIAIDASGNLFVTDKGNNLIRKITPGGLVSTFAGSTTSGHVDAQGTSARFNIPNYITVDTKGNIYVTEVSNVIRMITSGGMVSTLAGTGVIGYDDGDGSVASFRYPAGIVVDASGNIYVSDYRNYEIRKIVIGITTAVIENNLTGATISVFPNPAADLVNIGLQDLESGTIVITNLQGLVVLNQPVNANQLTISTASLQQGMYLIKVLTDKGSYESKITIIR